MNKFPSQVDKSLNKGMVGSDVYLCFKRSLNMAEKISYQVEEVHLIFNEPRIKANCQLFPAGAPRPFPSFQCSQ